MAYFITQELNRVYPKLKPLSAPQWVIDKIPTDQRFGIKHQNGKWSLNGVELTPQYTKGGE